MTGDGLFTMSMDSVSILVDSVLFRVITRDSGTRRWVVPAGGDHAYDTRDTNICLLTNSILFIMDTTGLWEKYTGSMLFYAVQPDTVYHSGDTLVDSMPIPVGHQRIDYQRKTDSTEVIVNGMDTANFYTTIIDSSCGEFLRYFTSINDSIRWLENIGPYYRNVTVFGSYGIDQSGSTTERYSLISFNGTPISITPTSGVVRNTTPTAKKNVYRGHGKIVWLGDGQRSFKNAGSNRYFNLTGRRINPLQGAQLLIYKKQ